MRQRPLSPHLGIYRFAYTMATSIAHRATGLVLSAGFALLTYGLVAIANGPEAYAVAQLVFVHPLVKVLLAGWLLAFCYHLFNGLRHLNWDFARGLEKSEARRSAGYVVVATLLLFVVLAALAFSRGGAA
jgi:succinate dehydrogenase / fumarate reductase cytochrome b subunit